VEFRRELTRMGVAGEDVEQVRARMIDDFMASSGSYLAGSAFPGQFVRRKVEEAGKERRFVPKIL
ncbi:MAG: hypothetical protein GWN87_15475, partial [Desulfuromonadales bacterium]|nr:hypothetical protein [Desulfuromonadales bacterium]NIS43205.1 hypothetical protein [Desulfuromonadales bacterium]